MKQNTKDSFLIGGSLILTIFFGVLFILSFGLVNFWSETQQSYMQPSGLLFEVGVISLVLAFASGVIFLYSAATR